MTCAFCNGETTQVMDFGTVALAGAFLKPEQFADEKRHHLSLHFCESCFLVQVGNPIPPAQLFTSYFYRTSDIGTMRKHFRELAGEIVRRFAPGRVVEIGCNDGALLAPLVEKGVECVGVDPSDVAAKEEIPGAEIINGYFGRGVVTGKADVVVACNVFAHIDNINEATAAVCDLLTGDGVFILEINRLDGMVADLQYDWVYHEHRMYFSLLALRKHFANYGLEVFDLQRIPTHAGSMRVFVGRRGRRAVSASVIQQIERELWMNLDQISRYFQFANDANKHRMEFCEVVDGYKGDVAGYGACGRANTLLQFCGLDTGHIPYIVDDAPPKHGFYTPGTHIPVRAELGNPSAVVVFAWSFLPEIQGRMGAFDGEIIVPLPHVYYHRRRAAA